MADEPDLPPYGNGTLPPGIRSRSIVEVNGLSVHILEAGYETVLQGSPERQISDRILPAGASRPAAPCLPVGD